MVEVEVYESFAHVPFDDEPDIEGDDRLTWDERQHESMRFLSAHEVVKPAVYRIVCPYPGLLHEGVMSEAVYACKRMVHRADGTLPALMMSPAPARMRWGALFTTKLKRAQRRKGIYPSGVWDAATHKAFAPYADSLAISLIHSSQTSTPTPAQLQRNAVLSFLMAFYNRRYNIPYDQDRPTQLRPVKKITKADCSGMVATAMWTAHVLPKVDWRWTNTDTQIRFGVSVSHAELRVADVSFYGHGTNPSHEACVVSADNHDVRVLSNGSYPARLLPLDYNRGRLGGRIALRRFIA